MYLYPKFERSSVLSVCSLGRIRLISHSLSANEQYFSLTLNQPTLLSAMAYKPNKPKRTGPCLETLATHLYLLYEDDSDTFHHQKKWLTIPLQLFSERWQWLSICIEDYVSVVCKGMHGLGTCSYFCPTVGCEQKWQVVFILGTEYLETEPTECRRATHFIWPTFPPSGRAT